MELELGEDERVEGPILIAMLESEDGTLVRGTIPLAERIRNEDGNLRFSMSHLHGVYVSSGEFADVCRPTGRRAGEREEEW